MFSYHIGLTGTGGSVRKRIGEIGKIGLKLSVFVTMGQVYDAGLHKTRSMASLNLSSLRCANAFGQHWKGAPEAGLCKG